MNHPSFGNGTLNGSGGRAPRRKLPNYTVTVVEVLHRQATYVVEAESEEKALEAASSGDTLYEQYGPITKVADRQPTSCEKMK